VSTQPARDLVVTALLDIAPEVDPDALDASAPVRDAADLDSMDVLSWIGAIAEALGADIPEDDYPQLDTLDGAVAYVAARLG
jgi:acyl carrier protein